MNRRIMQLEREYMAVARSVRLEEAGLDYGLLDGHVRQLEQWAAIGGSVLSVYDCNRMEHAYESPTLCECFKNEQGVFDGVQIHPDDYEAVMKNAVAAMKYVFRNNKHCRDLKMIREYRAFAYGQWRRITEQFFVLETDQQGNAWLTLSVVDVSPNQSAPFKVCSRLVNHKSGDVFSPIDEYYDSEKILSHREVEVLSLVAQGMLSKEIAEGLHISIATVNNHRQHILEKLKVDNSMEAVRYAQVLGILPE